VIELLPDRDGGELKTWLGQHPEIEILSRDRWAPYAEAAATVAPQAQQRRQTETSITSQLPFAIRRIVAASMVTFCTTAGDLWPQTGIIVVTFARW
jgi:hypothetical protein